VGLAALGDFGRRFQPGLDNQYQANIHGSAAWNIGALDDLVALRTISIFVTDGAIRHRARSLSALCNRLHRSVTSRCGGLQEVLVQQRLDLL
jgi:hypothetical protein